MCGRNEDNLRNLQVIINKNTTQNDNSTGHDV